jgi:hypothetical protein
MSDQRKPFSWEDWCAQPGTDAFGHPWSSWIQNPRPAHITEHQVDLIAAQLAMRAESRRSRRAAPVAAASICSPQLELAI